ncbi:hypothetical protein K7472_11005 [Streptomyces sp. PTM05]|uniref:DUF4352 domain-containing protein n=1 Tax=Streptantibioticus parmotrematis TaxID=2873249 RepID=A0ABS7QSK9_9ACTN|nr:hypothetical protein [Streptantibioticus parmotrematis]MBY8885375.1 hypothetical protein [Streptantibioticus parmotrematis]
MHHETTADTVTGTATHGRPTPTAGTSAGTSAGRALSGRWRSTVVPAVALCVAVGALAGCGGGKGASSPRTADVGQALTVNAHNLDGDSSGDVQVKVTVASLAPGPGGTTALLRLVNTSKHTTTLTQNSFVSVDDSGDWHLTEGYTTTDTTHAPTNGYLEPGQTLTLDALFPGGVTKILYNEGGFVTGGNGAPAKYTSEIQDTWTARN